MIIMLLLTTSALFAETNIIINAVGDTMIGTLYPVKLLPPDHGKAALNFVRPYLTNGNPDILIANLEGAATYYNKTLKDVSTGRSFAFQMPPGYLKYLKEAGFNAVNTANNHALDFGERGFSDTRKYLDFVGIKYTGAKNEVLQLRIKGRKIAIIGFTWFDFSNNILKLEECVPFIKAVSLSNDIVIIEVHGGSEGEPALHLTNTMEYFGGNPRGNMVRFAHLAVDNGADLIIGHSPHVPRAMELYKNKLIAYSLGNFVTYSKFITSGSRKFGLILNVSLNEKGDFISGRIIPLIQFTDGIYKGIPKYDEKGNVIKLIRKLSGEDIKNNPLIIEKDGTMMRN